MLDDSFTWVEQAALVFGIMILSIMVGAIIINITPYILIFLAGGGNR